MGNYSNEYIAHIRKEDAAEQKLQEHLMNTAAMTENFAKIFDNGKLAYYLGLYHDIGKYSDKFQKKIRENLNIHCDHSTAGAKELYHLHWIGKLLSYCIAGHHSGLPNSGTKFSPKNDGTLYERLSDEYSVENYEAFKSELTERPSFPNPELKPLEKAGFSVSFFIRMLYSCLVDADFLDTESFMKNSSVNRNIDYVFKLLLEKLNEGHAKFDSTGLINSKRQEILKACQEKGKNEPKGLFTLTVPTGGGKTLSSMSFALNHLIKYNMKRIIYVIPYTSIIEQNAAVFKDIFGDEYVLEHHSNYVFEDNENEFNIKKLSSENWDIPIVVTTNVQFFESLFANKSSKCRKLHNIADSVIIFDEAQMLPTELLLPCLRAISELVYNYKCTAVLCTATQPSLSGFFPKQIGAPKEICDNYSELNKIFKRTNINVIGKTKSNDFPEIFNKNKQCLVIVNTRKHALKLYKLMEDDKIYHLSALMCPLNRSIKINEIKERLKNGLPCKVISTSLIEAGVDIDFPVVYRAACGLDSIIQAAGRCNREGKLRDKDGNLIHGQVFVFEPENEFMIKDSDLFSNQYNAMKTVYRNFDDISSLDAIKCYFNELYFIQGKDKLDSRNIVRRLEDGLPHAKHNDDTMNFDFADIADDFKLIDNQEYVSVIIPFDEKSKKEIENLRNTQYFRGILRKLQPYTVNIYKKEFDYLCSMQKVELIKDNAVLKNIEDYSKNTGIKLNMETGISQFI